MIKKKKDKQMEEKEESLLVDGVEEMDNETTELDQLQEKIASLVEENAQLRNEYAKAYADTENTRRRLQQEADLNKKYRIQSFALDILPAVDNLERALLAEATEETEGYRKGVEMIYNQIVYALNKEGVEAIEALDQEFDPSFHQAIMVEKKEGVEPNMVIEVLQKGYKIKDRILRPSMVKVSE